jgi:RNA polymerase sigma factor (sigma-70 family)
MPNRKPASAARADQRSTGSSVLSQSMNGWLKNRLPNWPRLWAACIKRTHSWRVPPRWNVPDWWEEIDAESVAAACHALKIFDPHRGPDLGTFVYHQILASALSRYRQEWTYAIRYGLSAGDDAGVTVTEDRFAVEQDEKQLKETLTGLPEADQSLIKHLFWDGRTETDVATGLGITQQAVSKRKRRVLEKLRKTFVEKDDRRQAKKPKQQM